MKERVCVAHVLSYENEVGRFSVTLVGDEEEVEGHAERLGLEYEGRLLVTIEEDDEVVEKAKEQVRLRTN